ncbi:hypothetical protein [Catalinimonas niigatensis]|uniref:hypothetical protein n=1 Tax=Catalinimonas niigatensis TaxID=1397264 RepID=UPI002665F00B|nr:hypothetical protein [Catalinimonas niigatensis]WPP50590.1 hypothetical protein PZB72_28405 [Catalinimonas niigatensis]
MINKDHLLKLLQQLDETLMKVDDKKDENDLEGSLEIIKGSYRKLLGITPEQKSEGFLDSILSKEALAFSELNILAELLNEEGDIYFELGEYKKSLIKYYQTRDIFEYLNR